MVTGLTSEGGMDFGLTRSGAPPKMTRVHQKAQKLTFSMEDQMKRLAKLLDHAVQKVTGSVDAGACVSVAFTCCSPGSRLEHTCFGNCTIVDNSC